MLYQFVAIVPKGTSENSPAFQRGVQCPNCSRPEGTAEIPVSQHPVISAVPSGTRNLSPSVPSLKRRAIFRMSLRDKRTHCGLRPSYC